MLLFPAFRSQAWNMKMKASPGFTFCSPIIFFYRVRVSFTKKRFLASFSPSETVKLTPSLRERIALLLRISKMFVHDCGYYKVCSENWAASLFAEWLALFLSFCSMLPGEAICESAMSVSMATKIHPTAFCFALCPTTEFPNSTQTIFCRVFGANFTKIPSAPEPGNDILHRFVVLWPSDFGPENAIKPFSKTRNAWPKS